MTHVRRWLRAGWMVAAVVAATSAASALASTLVPQTPVAGRSIPRFVEPLPTFVGTRVTGTNLTVSMNEFQQKVLPASFYAGLPAPFSSGTFVWGYDVNGTGPLYPGVTIEARKGVPTTVTYTNNLVGSNGT